MNPKAKPFDVLFYCNAVTPCENVREFESVLFCARHARHVEFHVQEAVPPSFRDSGSGRLEYTVPYRVCVPYTIYHRGLRRVEGAVLPQS